jgi:drug/metabolite transporter (DMT)-like permease
MIYLALAIVFTSCLTLAFKITGRFSISTLQTIVFNYITCVVIGSLVNGQFPINKQIVAENWFWWAVAMGSIFIVLFNIIAFTTQSLGVAVASVANKLSLVIPFLFSFLLYGDALTITKIIGILLALGSVVLTCWPHSQLEGSTLKPTFGWAFILPIVLFFGSGFLDAMVKYVEASFLNAQNSDSYFITAFATAALLGTIILIVLILSGKEKFDPRSIIAGICVGFPNYFSIWCLVKVLKQFQQNSSAIFPIVNIGIVLFSTLIAFFVFREKLSKLNWFGIVVAILAIIMLSI